MVFYVKWPIDMVWHTWPLMTLLRGQQGIKTPRPLSLYSTATQNTWRRGLAFGNAPDTRILRYLTQNIPTCWYILRQVTDIFCVLLDAKPKSCVLPDAKPERKPVEYRLRWVPGVGSLCWACTFHIFCADFICVG